MTDVTDLLDPDLSGHAGVEREPSQHLAAGDDPQAPDIKPPPYRRIRRAARAAALGALGGAALIGLWSLASVLRPDLPSPPAVLAELRSMLADPLRDAGPNDKGILLQMMLSLGKVFAGFTGAAVVGIPLGFGVGAVSSLRGAINPAIQILRPVSPLAWFPIALVLFKDGAKASMFTIGITALWPILINTAAGAAGVPQDHRNVARIFRFSRLKYLRHVLIPHSMASALTGMRLSMGIAWMVIVATEMLSGSGGVGFFVWDSYNNNNLAAVFSAIALIGVTGFVLDFAFIRLARRFDYSKVAP